MSTTITNIINNKDEALFESYLSVFIIVFMIIIHLIPEDPNPGILGHGYYVLCIVLHSSINIDDHIYPICIVA